jgi:hypothetical protein
MMTFSYSFSFKGLKYRYDDFASPKSWLLLVFVKSFCLVLSSAKGFLSGTIDFAYTLDI